MDQQSDLKIKLQQLMDKLQEEVKKTAKIGVKMISASKTNTELNKYYEELGEYFYCALKKGDLTCDHSEVKKLMDQIDAKVSELDELHRDMHHIKRCKVDSSKKDGGV